MSMDNERAPARTVILASLLCLAIFSGCGQKGPLYLPDEPPPAVTENSESPDT